nr:hypothetical protein GCM10010200_030430 [Actinomadura rugatobispora]
MSKKDRAYDLRPGTLGQGDPTQYNYDAVAAHLQAASAVPLQEIWLAYHKAHGALRRAEDSLGRHVRQLNAIWQSDAQQLGVAEMKQLIEASGTLADVSTRFQSAASAVRAALESAQSSMPPKQNPEGLGVISRPGAPDASPARYADDKRAQQHLASTNTSLSAAFDQIPETVAVGLPGGPQRRIDGGATGSAGGTSGAGTVPESYTGPAGASQGGMAASPHGGGGPLLSDPHPGPQTPGQPDMRPDMRNASELEGIAPITGGPGPQHADPPFNMGPRPPGSGELSPGVPTMTTPAQGVTTGKRPGLPVGHSPLTGNAEMPLRGPGPSGGVLRGAGPVPGHVGSGGVPGSGPPPVSRAGGIIGGVSTPSGHSTTNGSRPVGGLSPGGVIRPGATPPSAISRAGATPSGSAPWQGSPTEHRTSALPGATGLGAGRRGAGEAIRTPRILDEDDLWAEDEDVAPRVIGGDEK